VTQPGGTFVGSLCTAQGFCTLLEALPLWVGGRPASASCHCLPACLGRNSCTLLPLLFCCTLLLPASYCCLPASLSTQIRRAPHDARAGEGRLHCLPACTTACCLPAGTCLACSFCTYGTPACNTARFSPLEEADSRATAFTPALRSPLYVGVTANSGPHSASSALHSLSFTHRFFLPAVSLHSASFTFYHRFTSTQEADLFTVNSFSFPLSSLHLHLELGPDLFMTVFS